MRLWTGGRSHTAVPETTTSALERVGSNYNSGSPPNRNLSPARRVTLHWYGNLKPSLGTGLGKDNRSVDLPHKRLDRL